jgi:hypothetical protein
VPYFTTAEAGKALKELERLLGKVNKDSLYDEAININCVIPLIELLKSSQEENRLSSLLIFSRLVEDSKTISLFLQHNLCKSLVGKCYF